MNDDERLLLRHSLFGALPDRNGAVLIHEDF
jgi:hypothetical protein